MGRLPMGRLPTGRLPTGRPLTAERAVGALVLVKAVDVALRGPQALAGPVWVVVLAAFAAAGIALGTGRLPQAAARACWAVLLMAALALAVDYPLDLRRQHLFLLLGVALSAVVARDDAERLLLWRVQLTALYGVAALAKLNESFLGGDVLAVTVATGPLGGWTPPPLVLVLASVALITTEAVLAVTPWVPRLRRLGVAAASALHGGALLVASASALVGLRLVFFGGLAVALCAASAGLLPAPGVRRCRRSRRAGRRPHP